MKRETMQTRVRGGERKEGKKEGGKNVVGGNKLKMRRRKWVYRQSYLNSGCA